MRILRLHLHNFRCFPDVTVDLDEVTVFVGPNDAGKSTLLDALRCLLDHTDAAGEAWVRSGVETRLRYDPEHEGIEATLVGPVTVVAELGDLTDLERETFEPVAVDGVVRLGVYFAEFDDQRHGPCFLVPEGSPQATSLEADWVYESGGGHPMRPWSHDGWLWCDTFVVTLLGVGTRPWRPLSQLLARSRGGVITLVSMAGPEAAAADTRSLLEPFIESAIRQTVERLGDDLVDAIDDMAARVTYQLTNKLSQIVSQYVEGASAVVVHRAGTSAAEAVSSALGAAMGDVELYLARNHQGDPQRQTEEWQLPVGAEPLVSLGAGTRRAIALSMLELYSDTDLWPPDQSVLLLIEEPEVGLHPAAQRRVARALQGFRHRSGIQALIVTHSPVLIDAASEGGVRLVRRLDQPGHNASTVFRPQDLPEVAELVGARASDVLLAAAFVIVEGPADVRIYEVWARKLGIALAENGIKLLEAEGWSKAAVVAKMHRIMYPGAQIHVLLDGGKGPESERKELIRQGRLLGWGDRVRVAMIDRTEVEGCFTESAVERWLLDEGKDPGMARGFREAADRGKAKSELKTITRKALGRGYRVIEDGQRIASLTEDHEIPLSVRTILYGIAVGDERGS